MVIMSLRFKRKNILWINFVQNKQISIYVNINYMDYNYRNDHKSENCLKFTANILDLRLLKKGGLIQWFKFIVIRKFSGFNPNSIVHDRVITPHSIQGYYNKTIIEKQLYEPYY